VVIEPLIRQVWRLIGLFSVPASLSNFTAIQRGFILRPEAGTRRMSFTFDLQGHRGARGQKPENTLPSFEAALDSGVTSIETDLHLTRDGTVVLCHDPVVPGWLYRSPGSSEPLLISTQTLDQLREGVARPEVLRRAWRDSTPFGVLQGVPPERFPEQDASVTPLARLFANQRGIDSYTLPTLLDLFDFANAYAGELGAAAGKAESQRAKARSVEFDLELKRVPGHPEYIGDEFDGESPALLEERVVEAMQHAGVVERTRVRSFDHRSVRAVRQLLPSLRTAVIVGAMTRLNPVELTDAAQATMYCPCADFLDEHLVRQLHEADVKVLPWTVNDLADLMSLVNWGVDGVTTDYPERFARKLYAHNISF
jgi:glycerophosphoryl diester phosphodiesterase